MPQMYSSKAECRKFRICDGESETGNRLGGRAPEGIEPASPDVKYFFSMEHPLKDEQEISVFISSDPDFIFSDNRGRVIKCPEVDVVLHNKTHRGSETKFDSELSEHPIAVSPIEADEIVQKDHIEGDKLVPYDGHKIGGLPYFEEGEPELEEEVANFLKSGFVHFVQFVFVGEEDVTVSGDWPLGDAVFHVLCKFEDDNFDWRVFWE